MSHEQHLAYEVRQLRLDLEKLYDVWPAMHGATPTQWVDGVAYFEAALVHVRNLIEFLIRGDPHGDALAVGDFGLTHYDYLDAKARFEHDVGRSADEVYADICTYVSHLSKSRSLETPGWELQPIEASLCELVKLFADQVLDVTGVDLVEVRDALEADLAEWD